MLLRYSLFRVQQLSSEVGSDTGNTKEPAIENVLDQFPGPLIDVRKYHHTIANFSSEEAS